MIDNWKLVVTERFAKFDGRAGRAEFWWFALANLIVYVILAALGAASNLFFILYFVFAIAMILPSIGVAIRRLHDTNKTGWLLLLQLIPIVGFIILFVFMVTAGDTGANPYGEGPEPSGAD
jgi:uncharacterized membrane protein YhaH (DUF805 family)